MRLPTKAKAATNGQEVAGFFDNQQIVNGRSLAQACRSSQFQKPGADDCTAPQGRELAAERAFGCWYHRSAGAVACVAVCHLTSAANEVRPLCAACFDRLRNVFGVLAAQAAEAELRFAA